MAVFPYYYRMIDSECRFHSNPFTMHRLSSMRFFGRYARHELSVFLLDSKVGKLSY